MHNYTNSPIRVEIVSKGHTNFLVKVELNWIQEFGSSKFWFIKTFDQHIEYYL